MKKLGKHTLKMDYPAHILQTASIVGPKEAHGPLAEYFDKCVEDEFYGEKSWEKAESKFMKETSSLVLSKAGLSTKDIDYIFSGDLLNQCISSTFAMRESNVPFFGIFGACSTFAEALTLGAVFIDSQACNNILCATSSHFCSAEKQFRFPLELGNQRTPTGQWTVTGSGAVILNKAGSGPHITYVTPGVITDLGIKDASNMGAAMAPAALSTLVTHFEDTGRKPDYYDAIITGDLGYIGKDILIDLASSKGYDISGNYNDCGVLMFDQKRQDTHAGGSGCACSATVFSSYFYNLMLKDQIKKMLLIATGALMNATSSQQGESIPGIAHAVSIEME